MVPYELYRALFIVRKSTFQIDFQFPLRCDTSRSPIFYKRRLTKALTSTLAADISFDSSMSHEGARYRKAEVLTQIREFIEVGSVFKVNTLIRNEELKKVSRSTENYKEATFQLKSGLENQLKLDNLQVILTNSIFIRFCFKFCFTFL